MIENHYFHGRPQRIRQTWEELVWSICRKNGYAILETNWTFQKQK
jgi:Holliday junction resolvase-like predicted endonuclease